MADGDAAIRVSTGRLDDLVDSMGELVIAQSMIAQDVRGLTGDHSRLVRSVSQAGKIARQLQDLAMSLRMVPLRSTFRKLARLVRDLAEQSGKAVRFEVCGEDTEIDRKMVQVLEDPLGHMIRNAMDHGLEAAAQRQRCGKCPTGRLSLRAYHAAGSVVIELEDDGQGLCRERILRKAVERGLVPPESTLSDEEIHALIFHPGLSTAEKVTDVSGRGVGMDVVWRNVESLRGRIEIATEPEKGTKFTLRLPLTMAIIDAMLLQVGRQRYLLPTAAIERNFRPDPAALSTVAGRGELVMLAGQLYPLFRLHRLFDIDGAIVQPDRAMAIVIDGAGKRFALMVDEILGQQQAVVKSLGKTFAHARGLMAGAILADGQVGLILDPVGLVQLAHGQRETAPTCAGPHVDPRARHNRWNHRRHPCGATHDQPSNPSTFRVAAAAGRQVPHLSALRRALRPAVAQGAGDRGPAGDHPCAARPAVHRGRGQPPRQGDPRGGLAAETGHGRGAVHVQELHDRDLRRRHRHGHHRRRGARRAAAGRRGDRGVACLGNERRQRIHGGDRQGGPQGGHPLGCRPGYLYRRNEMFMKMTLRMRILTIGIVLTLVPMAVLSTVVYRQNANIIDVARAESTRLASPTWITWHKAFTTCAWRNRNSWSRRSAAI